MNAVLDEPRRAARLHRRCDSEDGYRRLALAVISQAAADLALSVSQGDRSPSWRTVCSAVRFLLYDVWDDESLWCTLVAPIARGHMIDAVRARVGQNAFDRVVTAVRRPGLGAVPQRGAVNENGRHGRDT